VVGAEPVVGVWHDELVKVVRELAAVDVPVLKHGLRFF
jgi:hypothetical protein